MSTLRASYPTHHTPQPAPNTHDSVSLPFPLSPDSASLPPRTKRPAPYSRAKVARIIKDNFDDKGLTLEEFIFDFLGNQLSIAQLCTDYELTPREMEAIIDSDKAQDAFETIERITQRRAAMHASTAPAVALATLARISVNTEARPETQRKAASLILSGTRANSPAPKAFRTAR